MRAHCRLLIAALLTLPASLGLGAETAVKPGTYSVRTEIRQSESAAPIVTNDEDCFTAAEARDAHALLMRTIAENDDDDCERTNVRSAGGKVSFDMRCKDIDGTVTESRAEVTFGGDWYKAEMISRTGKDVIRVKSDGKWVRAGCAR